jgi:hypothetical protein
VTNIRSDTFAADYFYGSGFSQRLGMFDTLMCAAVVAPRNS